MQGRLSPRSGDHHPRQLRRVRHAHHDIHTLQAGAHSAPYASSNRDHTMSKRLYIQDVATREGFQIEASFVPT